MLLQNVEAMLPWPRYIGALSTLWSYNVSAGTHCNATPCAGTLHFKEVSTNGAMLFLHTFPSTILLPHSMMPLPNARTYFSIHSGNDAWAQKLVKKLWINPLFHVIEQVMHNLKQDKTQVILVVRL